MNERKLTKSELAKREDIIMKMKDNKRALVQKYGKDAEAVMYGRATNLAKTKAEAMDQDKLREMIKDALKNPKKADLNKDGKLSDYEKKRGAAIEKSMVDEIDLDLKGGTQSNTDDAEAGILGAEDVLGLEEGASSEEKRIAMSAIKRLAKHRGVSNSEARTDLIRAAKEVGDLNENFNQVDRQFDDLTQVVKNIANVGEMSIEDAAMGAIDHIGEEFNVDLEFGRMNEDLDLGHEDNEPGMLKAELYHIGSYAMELYKIMDNLEGMGEEIDLPAWWQSKITTAKNMISGAKHYLEFELKEPAIDAMVDTLSENKDSTDEAEKLIIKSLKDEGGAAGLDPLVKAVKKLDMSKGDVVSLLKKMAKVKLHKNGDYILFPVIGEVDNFNPKKTDDPQLDRFRAKGQLEGLPKGFWDKKMDAKDEVNETLDSEAFDMAERIIDSIGAENAIDAVVRAMSTDDARLYLGAIIQDYGIDSMVDISEKNEVDESYKTLVNKIKKQGNSEKAAKAIAGAVASYKAKGGGIGPTAKQKG